MPYTTIEEYLSAPPQNWTPTKQRGHTLTGHCPIHSDRTPSFSYDMKKEFWYCHGACGEGGDLGKLILRCEGFPDTKKGWYQVFKIRDGKEKAVRKPRALKPPREKKVVTPQQRAILSIMTGWWHGQIRVTSQEVDDARGYLIFSRGVANEIIDAEPGVIGYCPYDPSGAHFRHIYSIIKGLYQEPGIETALAMGIFYQDHTGALHLSQQGRVVFSCLDLIDMRTVYFQGRIVSDEHKSGCYIGAKGLPKAPFWVPIEDPVLDATIIVESPLGPSVLAYHRVPSLATLGNNPDASFLHHFPGPKFWGQDNDEAGEKQAAKYARYCEVIQEPYNRLRPAAEEKDVDKWVHTRGITPLLDAVQAQGGEGLFRASCFVL